MNTLLFDKIPASTIDIPHWRIQAFIDIHVLLFEKLTGDPRVPKKKHSFDEQTRAYQTSCEIKTSKEDEDMEIEIVTFVENESWKMNVLPDRHE